MRNAYSFTLSLFLSALILSGCGKSSEAPGSVAVPSQPSSPVLAVSLISADSQRVPQRLSVSGNVMPWQEVVVGLEVGGQRITEVLANVGDVVKKGQVLARLRTDALETELLAASASLAEARAALVQAQTTLSRAERLAPEGGISEQELSQYVTAADTARARVAVAQAQEANARLKLGFATLRAPVDGTVSSRTAAEGAIAPAGAELFRVIRQSRLEWRAEVPADQLHLVKVGSEVQVNAPGGALVPGTVRKISPVVDLATRNGLVYVDLARAGELKAGMHVAGELLGPSRSVILLPLSALSTRDGRAYVFTVQSGVANAAEVQLGSSNGATAEVLSGLKPGDRVVSQGAGFLKNGDRVSVVAPAGERP